MIEDIRELVGKRLLFSVRYIDDAGELIDRYQACGTVREVDDTAVTIDIRGRDEPFTLPAEPQAFDAGTPGEYRLHGTGETVVDPDYTSAWTVSA